MNKSKTGIAMAIGISLLIVENIYLGAMYWGARKELRSAETLLATKKYNERIVQFNQLFIDKVLKSATEVSFETRLKLENDVHDLNDKDILARWQAFAESKNELEAQAAVKNLL